MLNIQNKIKIHISNLYIKDAYININLNRNKQTRFHDLFSDKKVKFGDFDYKIDRTLGSSNLIGGEDNVVKGIITTILIGLAINVLLNEK